MFTFTYIAMGIVFGFCFALYHVFWLGYNKSIKRDLSLGEIFIGVFKCCILTLLWPVGICIAVYKGIRLMQYVSHDTDILQYVDKAVKKADDAGVFKQISKVSEMEQVAVLLYNRTVRGEIKWEKSNEVGISSYKTVGELLDKFIINYNLQEDKIYLNETKLDKRAEKVIVKLLSSLDLKEEDKTPEEMLRSLNGALSE